MNHLSKSQIMRRRLGRLVLVAAVPALAIGTSKGAWTDNVRVEARVTFAPLEQTEPEVEPALQREPSIDESELDSELDQTISRESGSQEIGKVVGGPTADRALPD